MTNSLTIREKDAIIDNMSQKTMQAMLTEAVTRKDVLVAKALFNLGLEPELSYIFDYNEIYTTPDMIRLFLDSGAKKNINTK